MADDEGVATVGEGGRRATYTATYTAGPQAPDVGAADAGAAAMRTVGAVAAQLRAVLGSLDMQDAALGRAERDATGPFRLRERMNSGMGRLLLKELQVHREMRERGASDVVTRDAWIGGAAMAAGVARDLLRDAADSLGEAIQGNVGRGAAAMGLALARRGLAHLPAVQERMRETLAQVERDGDRMRGVALEAARMRAAIAAERAAHAAALVELEGAARAGAPTDAAGRDALVARARAARAAVAIEAAEHRARRAAAALLAPTGQATERGQAYVEELTAIGRRAREAEEAAEDARRRERDFRTAGEREADAGRGGRGGARAAGAGGGETRAEVDANVGAEQTAGAAEAADRWRRRSAGALKGERRGAARVGDARETALPEARAARRERQGAGGGEDSASGRGGPVGPSRGAGGPGGRGSGGPGGIG